MANYTQKPHVSAALAHLQHGVSLAAFTVCICAVVQLLVFGFVHFTQVRYESNQRVSAVQPLLIVKGGTGHSTNAAGTPERAAPSEVPPPPKVLSAWDPTLHVMSDMAATVGVIGTCMLAAFCFLGVTIAGGGAVPGVERVVSAACWSLVLALAGIPWRDVLVSLPFPGVFSNYNGMAQLCDAVDAGQGSVGQLLAMHLLFPLAVIGGSLLALGRFRAGVAEGIILTSVSELDERLEKEIAQIRTRGVAADTPRAVAALNQAIGDKPGDEPVADPLPRRAPERQTKQVGGLAGLRARQADDAEDDFKRPI